MEKYFWKLTPILIINNEEYPFYDGQVITQSRSAYDQIAHAMHSVFCSGTRLRNMVEHNGEMDIKFYLKIKDLLVIRVEKYQPNTWAVYIDDEKFSPNFESKETAEFVEAQQKAICAGNQKIEVRPETLLISTEDIH